MSQRSDTRRVTRYLGVADWWGATSTGSEARSSIAARDGMVA
jgi:hypothetical protein